MRTCRIAGSTKIIPIEYDIFISSANHAWSVCPLILFVIWLAVRYNMLFCQPCKIHVISQVILQQLCR
jgi:hypothetical protein